MWGKKMDNQNKFGRSLIYTNDLASVENMPQNPFVHSMDHYSLMGCLWQLDDGLLKAYIKRVEKN
jgi:hypothetical protein